MHPEAKEALTRVLMAAETVLFSRGPHGNETDVVDGRNLDELEFALQNYRDFIRHNTYSVVVTSNSPGVSLTGNATTWGSSVNTNDLPLL